MTNTHRKSPPNEHQVVVLGGGPAGCAAAVLLAGRGHDVGLVRPETTPAGRLAESVPPSARRVLTELEILPTIESAGFHPNAGNVVWWADSSAHSESFSEGTLGFHADRSGLEKVLAVAACEAGAIVYDGLVGRGVEERVDGWRVPCVQSDGTAFELRAPWILDATGRRGVLAGNEGRKADRSTMTTALVRRWRRPGGFERAEPTHTLVESYIDGWAWAVPLAHDVRCFAAMVDHRYTVVDQCNLDATLDGELDKAHRLGGLREGAEPLGPTWACAASLYVARRFGRPGLLLVGDAASFIDPLSSFGVKKALSSGWLAGVTVHTALVDEPMRDVAVDFYEQRERFVYRSYCGLAADFFEEAARAYGHPYWSARATGSRAAAGQPAKPGGDPDAAGQVDVPPEMVRTAFERIRARPSLDARRAARVREVERPTVVGHRIVRARHIASDRVPVGLRYVRNVDLIRLVELAPRHRHVPDGWMAYNGEALPVALPDYLTALATAFAAGLLEHDDGPSGSASMRVDATQGATS